MALRKWATIQAACVLSVSMCLFANGMVYAADPAANKSLLKPACQQPAPLQGQFNPKAPRYIVAYKVSVQDPAKETEASVISTIKVERPPARSSEAPIRVNTRSTGPSRADFAGTKHPQ